MFLKNRQRGNYIYRALQYRIMQILVRIPPLLPDVQLGIGPGDKRGFVEMRTFAFEYKSR